MQNCGKSTFKRTSVDRLMNVLVLCVSMFVSCVRPEESDKTSFWVADPQNGTVAVPNEHGIFLCESVAFLFQDVFTFALNGIPCVRYFLKNKTKKKNMFFFPSAALSRSPPPTSMTELAQPLFQFVNHSTPPSHFSLHAPAGFMQPKLGVLHNRDNSSPPPSSAR